MSWGSIEIKNFLSISLRADIFLGGYIKIGYWGIFTKNIKLINAVSTPR